jgi:PKD repeat protein
MVKYYILFLVFAISTQIYGQKKDYTINLVSEKILTEENVNNILEGDKIDESIFQFSKLNGRYYTYIQFYEIPNEQIHKKLKASGINLLSYLPPNAYYISIPEATALNRLKSLGIRSFFNLKHIDKIIRGLVSFNSVPEANIIGDKVEVRITFAKDIKVSAAMDELSRGYEMEINKISETYSYAEVLVNFDDLEKITSFPYVFYVGLTDKDQYEDLNNNNIASHHHVAPVHSSLPGYYGLDGDGVTIAVGDICFADNHIDFQGRVTKIAASWVGDSDHGKHVTGTIAGAGNVDDRYRGLAYKADIVSGIFDHTEEYIDDHPEVVLSTHSHGGGMGFCDGDPYYWGQYTDISAESDQRLHNKPYLMDTRSCANSHTRSCYIPGTSYKQIGAKYTSAKNCISVGARTDPYRYLSNFNNFYAKGPTLDGRIKPELVALGELTSCSYDNEYTSKTGTSMATPLIAGILTLMHQKYKQDHNGDYPDNALMKAIACNTARDIGNSGPDFANGFGYINARRAVNAVSEGRFASAELSQGGSFDYTINVPDNVKELKVLICWNDPAGNPQVVRALVNDLNLTVTSPNNEVILPWVLDTALAHIPDQATRGVDSINNIEQVTISNPASGTYTATITGHELPNGGTQKVWITYDYIMKNEISLTYPIGGESFNPGEKVILSWDFDDSYASENSLAYSTDNGSTWTSLFNNNWYHLDYRFYVFNMPDVQSSECLVKVTYGDSVRISAPFTIMDKPENTVAVYPNDSTVEFSWSPVNGADGYNVYKLGEKYMELVGSTTDRKYTITGLDISEGNEWFAVSSKLGNGESRRTLAIQAVEAPTTPPVVGFRADPSSLGQGLIVQFTDTTSNYATDWQWSFPGGTPSTSTERNPVVTYNTSGHYDVTLTATNYFGNASITKTFYINVYDNGECVNKYPYFESFENQLPNLWIQDPDDDFDWTIEEGRTTSGLTGPLSSEGASDGTYYFYTEAGDHFNQTARLISPCLNFAHISNPFISFDYNMNGSDIGTLMLQASADGTDWDTLWYKTGHQSEHWLSATVSLSAYQGNSSIKLRICGKVGNGHYSDMAIDKILIDGDTPPVADFTADQTDVVEGSTINFTDQSINFPTSWSWEFEGGTPSTSDMQNPSVTYNTAGNYQVKLTATNEDGSNTKTKTGYITIGALPTAAFEGCGSYETGESISLTNNSTNADNYEWTFDGGEPSTSTTANPTVTYSTAGTYSVKLIAKNAYGNDTTISSSCMEITESQSGFCDDPVTTFPFAEGFESGFGDFTQETDDDFDWTNQSGGTPSTGTGPSGASEGSKYIYTESSYSNHPNKTAILYSPCFDLSQVNNAKFSFDYHMYGSSMGTFEIAVKTENDDWQAIFTKSGDQGNEWHTAILDLSSYDEVVKLRFKGTTASSYRSDIAVDNVVIGEGVVAAFTANNTEIDEGETVTFTDQSTGNPTSWQWDFGGGGTPATSTDQNPAITFNTAGTYSVKLIVINTVNSDTLVKNDYITVNESASSDCTETPYAQSFEDTLGNWVQDTNDDINWTNKSGGTPSTSTGPSGAIDGTYYIYIESSYENHPDKVANLTSPCFDLSGLASPTLKFQYHMYGATMGTLNVQISTDNGSSWTTLWTKSGDQGNSWHQALVSLSGYANNSNILIRLNGITGSNYTSDICVDDFKIESGSLSCATLSAPDDEATGIAVTTNLDWNEAPAATGYKLYFGTDNPPTNIENGTDLGNVTLYDPANDLSFNTTYYWKVVPYNADGDASGCDIWSFTTTDGSCSYCQIYYSNTDDDYISKVVFNTIDKSSGSSTYSDFTATSTDIEKGQQYTLSINITVNGNWYQYAKAWFDWNGDCDFSDAGEVFDLGHTPGSSGTHTLTVDVTVPDGALLGETRLRIAEHYGNVPTPCQNAIYGEGEDYTVNIIDGGKSAPIISETPVNLKVYPNPVNGNILNIESSEEITEVFVYGIRGNLFKVVSADRQTHLKMNVENLKPGVYLLKILTAEGVHTERLIVK